MKVGELRKQLDYFSDEDEICFVDYNDDSVIALECNVSWIKENVYRLNSGRMVFSAFPINDSCCIGEFTAVYITPNNEDQE